MLHNLEQEIIHRGLTRMLRRRRLVKIKCTIFIIYAVRVRTTDINGGCMQWGLRESEAVRLG